MTGPRRTNSTHALALSPLFLSFDRLRCYAISVPIDRLALLVIRAVYRLIELSDVWNGTIITTEIWFSEFATSLGGS